MVNRLFSFTCLTEDYGKQQKTRRALPFATGFRFGRLLTLLQGRPILLEPARALPFACGPLRTGDRKGHRSCNANRLFAT